jgi:hypothetical protein
LSDSWNARDSAILVAITALTRWSFRSRFLYDIDSVNFALALDRFDPRVYQPHPPGYFLYVQLGTLARSIFHDSNTALVAVSILASCGTVAMIHLLAQAWFGRAAAVFAGIIFVFSPLAWFHGTVALTYIVETFFSALVGYLCWCVYRGAAQFAIPAAVALGLATGFRQSSLVVLAPLVIFSFQHVSRRRAIGGLASLLLVLAAWFIPMIHSSGGLHAYVSSLWSLWTLVPARQTVLTSSIATSLVRLCLIVAIYGLCFGSAALLIFRRSKGPSPSGTKTFTCIWIFPGLLVFTLVYLKFVNSGYLLVLLPPACAWMGSWAADWYIRTPLKQTARIILIAAAAAINILIFVRAPLYCSYWAIQQSRQHLAAVVASVQQISQPQQTLLIGFDSHFQGYRHAGFYLPDYLTIQFPEVPLGSATGVFAMQNRQTTLTNQVAVGSFRDFILFPLPPSEKEYADYMNRIRARFPAGELHVTTQNGIEFLRGPISSLSALFPNTIIF